MPALSPGPRCALTAPFHPCRPGFPGLGGLFSVALSRARNADGWALPTTVPCGVRTFLPVNLSIHRAITQPFQLSCYEIGGFNSTARWGGACAFFFVHPFLSRRSLSGDSAIFLRLSAVPACQCHAAPQILAASFAGRDGRPPKPALRPVDREYRTVGAGVLSASSCSQKGKWHSCFVTPANQD